MENLTINTLDSDLHNIKQKYINAIQEYVRRGIEQLLEDNEKITDISASFFNYIHISPIFDNIKELEHVEIEVEDLSKLENYELWIESSDSHLILDTVRSRHNFKEASDLFNNLEIEFPRMFDDLDINI
jgi:hypothetical protein